MKKKSFLLIAFVLFYFSANSQSVAWQPDDIKALTSEWTGERLPDGRPKVADQLLERLKNISMEEVWGTLESKGYHHQFENFASLYENGWEIIHPEQVMTGRVVTAQFMPLRADFDKYIQAKAEKEGTKVPVTNYAPILKLMEGDVYVADAFGKMEYGTLIGDNLGNAIYKAGKRGIIYNGSVRDLEGLSEIEGFNGWIRGSDPSGIQEMLVAWINAPIRIGRVTVLPGDVVLAKKFGVTFIPAQFVQEVVISGEFTALHDEFSRYCMKTNKFPYVNERFEVERDVFEKAFNQWLNDKKDLPMTRKELDDYMTSLKNRKKPE